MSKTKRIVFSGLCIAAGVALPMAFHAIPGSGAIFLPMHIPVLLCGLVCGWQYGLACGIVTPIISFLITGMPAAAILPGMTCELVLYGFISGFMIKHINIKKQLPKIYTALIAAMLAGRIGSGILNMLIFNAGRYSIEMWVTAAFITSLPGIAIQIIVIPFFIVLLKQTRFID